MANLKVVIVGAGVVGASCARSLAREGADVVLLEQGEAPGVRGATAAGMGHITVNAADEASIQLCILGRRIWREDAPPNSEEDGFVEIGTLWMAEDDASLADLGLAASRLNEAGVAADLLEGSSLFEVEPALARDLRGGLRLPEDGAIYAPTAAASMVGEAVQMGATIRTSVKVLAVERGQVRLDDGTSISADAIVIASGLEALELCEETGVSIPILPREGHLAITSRGTCVLNHHVVEAAYQQGALGEVEDTVACAILPRSTGQLCIGSSRRPRRAGEVDSELIERIMVRSERFVPGISGLPVVRTWSGTRAATGDDRPLIGALPGIEGVWIAAGFEGLGITQAPAAAQLITCSILGQESPIDPGPWDPSRQMTTS
jgi:glycine/D-amino acid oxidase-like deaminating enzyme